MTNYEAAREKYAALGVDTDKAIETLKKVPVSLHCWQLDDVIGFDNDGGLTGGIQTTGNYMGRARTPEQLMADMEEAMRLTPSEYPPRQEYAQLPLLPVLPRYIRQP